MPHWLVITLCLIAFYNWPNCVELEARNPVYDRLQKLTTRSIGILINPSWRGEKAFAHRIESAGKNLGWNVTLLYSLDEAYAQKKFDWILTLTPYEITKKNSFKVSIYLALFDPVHHYFDAPFCLSDRFNGYDGYLQTFTNPIILTKKKHQKIYSLAWYPTAQDRLYKEVTPKKLFHLVGQWGNRLDNVEYQVMQALLSLQDYACFFGNPTNGVVYQNAYQGEIPYEGESIQDQIAEMGVCLVLHSDVHIAHEIPSGRIFEAAAAAAVIISDGNPFVKKHFGDSILYIDETTSGKKMFAQIDAHMHWIFAHPNEAKQMARHVYEIFKEKFLLENQLQSFDEWHQKAKFLHSVHRPKK